MVGCAAFGCTNRSEKGHRMYGFPKDMDRREKWLAKVCRENFEVRGNHNNRKICQAHFEDNQFLTTKNGYFRLRPDAVPMIFLHRSTPKRRKVPSRCMPSGVVIERSNDDHTHGRTPDLDEGDMAEEMPAGGEVDRTLLAVVGAEQHKLPVLKKVVPIPGKVVPIPGKVVPIPGKVVPIPGKVVPIPGKVVPIPARVKVTAPLPPVFKRPLQVLQPPTMGPPGGSYRCDECQQLFFSFPQFVRHKQFHDEERPFPCGVCGKRFLSRSHYKEHQRVHTGERPFPCDQCERSFTTHHNLKRHQTIHSKEEIFRCKRCGMLFCQKHVLPMEESPVFPSPDMEQDSDSNSDSDSNADSDPEPSQDSAPQTEGLALNTPAAWPAAPKSDILHQYRRPEKLQQPIETKLSQVPRWTNQSSFNSNLFLPANVNVSKKKTDKKRHSSHSVPMTSASGQEEELWSVHKKQPKMHRIAYDIEVVL